MESRQTPGGALNAASRGGGEDILEESEEGTTAAVTSSESTCSTAAKEEDEQELLIEQPLFSIKEVFVYRVPPLRAASGHRAEEWGLANPVFTGKARDLVR